MMETRYHGYPQPDLPVSDIMRRIAYNEWLIVFMSDTFEPFLLDLETKDRYALPDEIDNLTSLICDQNVRYRAERGDRT